MRNLIGTIVLLVSTQGLSAGSTSGIYREGDSGSEFSLGYALAERAADGSIRIVLAKQEPMLPARDRHLDRLKAVAEAAEGGYLMLEPTTEGNRFNVTVSLDDFSFGGGGQYNSQIVFGDSSANGNIDAEVLTDGHLKVTFEAEFLPARKKQRDLPADGGAAGAILLGQMQAVASGDRDAILKTLQPEQREQFNQMSAEEQADALSFLVDLTPRNVKVTGGSLYDGYAIVDFSGEADGLQATGQALVTQDGGQWLIVEVSSKFQ